jgi:hypothetical protein
MPSYLVAARHSDAHEALHRRRRSLHCSAVWDGDQPGNGGLGEVDNHVIRAGKQRWRKMQQVSRSSGKGRAGGTGFFEGMLARRKARHSNSGYVTTGVTQGQLCAWNSRLDTIEPRQRHRDTTERRPEMKNGGPTSNSLPDNGKAHCCSSVSPDVGRRAAITCVRAFVRVRTCMRGRVCVC